MEAVIGGNSILMVMFLEWDIQQSHIGVMVGFKQNFGHLVSIRYVGVTFSCWMIRCFCS